MLGFAAAAMLANLGLGLWALGLFDAHTPTLQLTEMVPWIPALGAQYAVGVDGLALTLMLMTLGITPLCLWSIAGRCAGKERTFAVCLLLLEGTVLGALAAIDLLLFYVFWEAMLIPAYFLIGVFGGAARVQAAQRFFVYTMAGSMVLLVAVIYAALFATQDAAPSFLWTDMMARFASQPVSYTELALFLAFALAFAIKVPLVPLHGWLPSAYAQAPQPVVVMLSAVMVKVGAFALLRYALLLFPRAATYMMPTLTILAVLGILYGACAALTQDSLRRILAYSSISHMGFVALGMFSMTPDALLGSGLQMVNHAISTGALFLLVGLLMQRQHTDALAHLGGLASRMPWLACACVVMALSSMGLPGLNGFVGEFMILLGTFGSDGLSLSIAEGTLAQGSILAVLVLTTVAMALAVRRLFAWGRRTAQGQAFPFVLVLTGSAVLFVLFLGLVSPPVGAWDGGVLMRPLLARSLSIMPFASFMPTMAVVATLGVVLGAVYLLVAIEKVFFGPTKEPGQAPQAGVVHHHDLTAQERWLVLPFVLGALVLGLYPAPVMGMLEPTMSHYAQLFRAQAGWPKPTAVRAAEEGARPPTLLVPVGPGYLNPSQGRAP